MPTDFAIGMLPLGTRVRLSDGQEGSVIRKVTSSMTSCRKVQVQVGFSVLICDEYEYVTVLVSV